jgi:hypothetical protein
MVGFFFSAITTTAPTTAKLILHNMTITVILGAQWGMFLSLTWNMSFLRTEPISVRSLYTDQDFHRRRRREYSGRT